jgi:hypothetical protein
VVFGVTALFPLIVSCSALLINEQRLSATSATVDQESGGTGGSKQPADGGEVTPLLQGAEHDEAGGHLHSRQLHSGGLGKQIAERASLLWGVVKGKGILMPVAFLFVWQSTPSYSDAMFYFQVWRGY